MAAAASSSPSGDRSSRYIQSTASIELPWKTPLLSVSTRQTSACGAATTTRSLLQHLLPCSTPSQMNGPGTPVHWLASVTYECGFADQSHLNGKFKAVYGLTPAAWMGGWS